MLHVFVIAMLAAIATHDAIVKDGSAFVRYYEGVSGWWTLPIVAVPMAVLAGLAWLACGAAAAMMDRGRVGAIVAAERACSAARVGAVCLHAANVLLFGWLDVVRSVTGDVIVLDELIAIAPTLGVFCLTWAAVYPIERRVRDSVTIRELDSGRAVYPMPTRGQMVLSHFRHQVLLSLVPMTMLLGWAECAEWGLGWLAERGAGTAASGVVAWLGAVARDPSTRSSALLAVQLVGVGLVLTVAPLALRMVWDTVRLSPGPLRERLVGMCEQHRVEVRELLVWRTHGAMINGAVMGLWGRMRYILLTDALLDSLPRQQVEAVMAHELGHVRHRHVAWLAAVMIGSLLGLSLVGSVVMWAFAWAAPVEIAEEDAVQGAAWVLGAIGLEAGVGVGMLAGTLLVFMYVSRRFEWQADAFAAMHLSTSGALSVGEAGAGGEEGECGAARKMVTAEAVAAMAGALEAVSYLNSVPLERGSWRHGSLGTRVRKLRRLVGTPLDAVPIDRTVKRVKVAAVVVLVVVAAAMGAVMWGGG